MERKVDLPPPTASGIPIRPIAGEGNHTATTSSSSSSSSSSYPDFLRQFHAVIKRNRPRGTMQSSISRASRVLVSPVEPSKSITGDDIGKRPSQAGAVVGAVRRPNLGFEQARAVVGAARRPNLGFDQTKDCVAEVRTNSPEEASLTPPSMTGTVTIGRDENWSPFGLQKGDEEQNKGSLAIPSSRVPLTGSNERMTTDTLIADVSSYMHTLALTEGEGLLSNRAAIRDNDPNQGLPWSLEVSGMKFGGGVSLLEKRDEPRHDRHYVDPMTRSSVAGSSCGITMSVDSGPTIKSTRAPLAGQTTFATEVLPSAAETMSHIRDHAVPEGRWTVPKEGDVLQDHQQARHLGEHIKGKGVSGDVDCSHSQVPSTNILSSNVGLDPSQSGKAEKAPRRKKYDPDVFFKVSRKLYQKLGKIGSGGSSEVHKVISSDCTIYALKKIKLKGRDYPTAYGFCHEIEYLNKLKGKKNIIQLIDYEVTDKALLEGVVNGTMSTMDGKIKDDQYIYMVLEYGEIDLAHMLSRKWKEMDSSGWKIDENWLRFYWQQMLEAVNTIHEERIVHSDLKPANFLLVKGSLKLIDFGIAKAIMSDTTNIQRDAQVGTLNYMSPEAFMWNEHNADGSSIKCGRPSDIWSLGCILYQMVYGKTPFAEYKTFWAKFKAITDRKHEIGYEPVSNPCLVDLMRRCLAWDRDERWRIPELLQHPFLAPPMPRELPLSRNHPCELLMQRVRAHWDDPGVSRICCKLRETVDNIETDPDMHDAA